MGNPKTNDCTANEGAEFPHSVCSPWWPLFEHMAREHGLTLLDSELDEIARAAMSCQQYFKFCDVTSPGAEGTINLFWAPGYPIQWINNLEVAREIKAVLSPANATLEERQPARDSD